MKFYSKAFLALILALVAITDARITSKPNTDEKSLLKIEEEKSGVLDLDEDDYSGDYEDDEYYYDDEDDDDLEGSGFEDDEEEELLVESQFLDDLKLVERNGGEFHFVEEEEPEKKGKDSDLLFEYYNEIYEEDYEDVELSDVETSILPKKPTEPQELPKPENGLNYTNVLMMVASAMVSFGVFTLAFVLCCYRQRGGKSATKHKNLATIKLGSPEKTVHAVVTPSGYHVVPPPSSIVKNYHLVPQDAVDFMSTSSDNQTGMENPSNVLNEKREPLLP